jgi:DNA-binding transcriptional ArsR family regulator
MHALGDRLRLLADETRLRVLHLLQAEPLTVAELQELLDLGQSSISGHLAKLKTAGLIHDVPEGSSRRYRLRADPPDGLAATWQAVLALSSVEPQVGLDRERLDALRRSRGAAWVDRVAGSLHREYAPGRTWESLCQGLLFFADFGRCIDIGAGDGAMLELIAPRARSLTCVDPSEAMVAAGTARLESLRAGGGFGEVRFLTAPGEAVPVENGCADSVLFLQSLQYIAHPDKALREAGRLLAPGGRLLVLTLVAHQFAESDRYGHRHRGFTPRELTTWCKGLTDVRTDLLPPETRPPHFQTVILTARKPA